MIWCKERAKAVERMYSILSEVADLSEISKKFGKSITQVQAAEFTDMLLEQAVFIKATRLPNVSPDKDKVLSDIDKHIDNISAKGVPFCFVPILEDTNKFYKQMVSEFSITK